MNRSPVIRGVYETVLYAEDVLSAAAFYTDVLGLTLLRPASVQSAVFRLNPEAMLLVFAPAWSEKAGRGAPEHGARGNGHLALRVDMDDLSQWRERLARLGVAIELERGWDPGGRSIYIRDPAGNSVELAAGEVWG